MQIVTLLAYKQIDTIRHTTILNEVQPLAGLMKL